MRTPHTARSATAAVAACIVGLCFLTAIVVLYTEFQRQRMQVATLLTIQDVANINVEERFGRTVGLYIEGEGFENLHCGKLANLPWLSALELHNTSVSADGINAIKELPQLGTLWIETAEMPDEAVLQLATMRNIEWLRFTIAGISSDEMLRQFSSLQKLQYLTFIGHDVDPSVLQFLRSELPNCEIAVEPPSSRSTDE